MVNLKQPFKKCYYLCENGTIYNSDTDNPIGNACDEFGMSPCYMINTTPPNKHRKLSMWVRRHITKEEWDWLRQE